MPRQPITSYDPNSGSLKTVPPLTSFVVVYNGDLDHAKAVLQKFKEIAPEVCARTCWFENALAEPAEERLQDWGGMGVIVGNGDDDLRLNAWGSPNRPLNEFTAYVGSRRTPLAVEEFLKLQP